MAEWPSFGSRHLAVFSFKTGLTRRTADNSSRTLKAAINKLQVKKKLRFY